MSASRQKHIYDYYIDEHGNWFCEGNFVIDRRLFRLLSRSLFQEHGRYFVRCEGETHPVRIRDAPLWIRCVHVQTDSKGNLVEVEIELEDGRREPLAADTLTVVNDRALYCLSTPRRLKTRFAKTAYYEITRYLQVDHEGGRFYFNINDIRYDIISESEELFTPD